MYYLVFIDDYSRFTWVFFLATKEETSGILKSFITGIENLVDHKVKVIRYDNGTEFKNREMRISFVEWKVFKQNPKSYSHDDGSKPSSDDEKKVDEDPRKENECNNQEKEDNVNSTNIVNAAGTNKVNAVGEKTSIELLVDPNMPALEDYSIFDFIRDDEDNGVVADMNNLDTTIKVSPIPNTRIHKDHPLNQVIRDLQSATQTRKMSKNLEEHGFVSTILQRTNHKDLQNCLFACFLSQEEPKKVIHALKDPSWIEAIQEELLQFKLQEVWTLVDLPNKKRAIGSKWIFRNKKDERETVIRNKARLVTQGFVVYQMTLKSAFLYGIDLKEDVYTDSDYARASFDRKSTTGGCQFLRCRLISWQCKKQTMVANSITEAEYVAASSCCGQVCFKIKIN
ncbi:putative ribonuclease H-like domain-containing protein [Tanacetum coccineum]